jgi:hypothetical protein
MGRLLASALAPIILKWPRSVQHAESVPSLDFVGTGNACGSGNLPEQIREISHSTLTLGRAPFPSVNPDSYELSSCSSALASLRSAVSKPSVNQL